MSSDGLRVDLLVTSTAYKLAGLTLGFDAGVLTGPLRSAGLLQGDPVDANGGTLFKLLMPEGSSVALPIGEYAGTITLGTQDGQLILGVPMIALPFLASIQPYVVEVTDVDGGGKVLTLDLPRDRVASFTVLRVEVSIRLPSS